MLTLHPHDLVRPDATIRYWTGGAPARRSCSCTAPRWTTGRGTRRPRPSPRLPRRRPGPARPRRVHRPLRLRGSCPGHPRPPGSPSRPAGRAGRAQPRRQHRPRGHPPPTRPRRELVVADATCNTADRHPLAATTTIAALRVQALWPGDEFARQAARATAPDPRVQNYVLEVNAHRSNGETVEILTSLLTTALRPDPSYRLPVPALLVHGQLDHIGDIATDMRGWAHAGAAGRYAVITEPATPATSTIPRSSPRSCSSSSAGPRR